MGVHTAKCLYPIIFLLGMLLLGGCTDSQTSPGTLTLTLKEKKGNFEVIDYDTSSKTYQDSHSQGGYRVHLVDKEDKVLREIGFQLMDSSSFQDSKSSTFKLPLPLVKGVQGLIIYKLDLSSGHYQLQQNAPLLNWTIPDSLAK